MGQRGLSADREKTEAHLYHEAGAPFQEVSDKLWETLFIGNFTLGIQLNKVRITSNGPLEKG